MRKGYQKNKTPKIISIIVAICALFGIGTGVLPEWLGDDLTQDFQQQSGIDEKEKESSITAIAEADQDENKLAASLGMIDFDLDTIPEYSGEAYVAINGNEPDFAEKDLSTKSYEYYSELDHLGRCGVTVACLGQDLMPTEDRESISHVKPSGWIQGQYDFVDGKSLYNRCHLIGFQLAGENANEKNLITGTRYMNTIGMLPFENMVADYIKETGNHVMYRVTPIYDGDNLVASGVQMEGYSVEDEGDGIFFNVYAYNVQPGVEIDYATGENQVAAIEETGEVQDYVLNTSSKKFHLPDCNGLSNTKKENKQEYEGTREMLLAQGYEACKSCNP